MAVIHFQQSTFLTGAAALSQLPADSGVEVAFAGRSNAGKSSAMNAITGINSLARTSKTPGRTQQINFFAITEQQRLVDLPGYGYAQAPKAVRDKWMGFISDYLRSRHSLQGLIIVMDCRHPLKPFDEQLIQWCCEAQLPAHILLSKADKFSHGAAKACLHQVRQQLQEITTQYAGKQEAEITVQLFSALKKKGLDEARACLTNWLTE